MVANSVFRDVIGQSGILRGKTRIMVCNQVTYMHHMDKIVFVHDKKARVYASLEELLRDSASPKNFHISIKQRTAVTWHYREPGRITEDEMARSKTTSWLLLEGLIRFTPWQAPMGVALLVTAAAAQAVQQIWIKSWTDASTADSDAVTGTRRYWIGVLVGICVANGEHCMMNRNPLVYVSSNGKFDRRGGDFPKASGRVLTKRHHVQRRHRM
ncbi:hypothetical protein MRX96_004211 [Rhipicephalus microplus]